MFGSSKSDCGALSVSSVQLRPCLERIVLTICCVCMLQTEVHGGRGMTGQRRGLVSLVLCIFVTARDVSGFRVSRGLLQRCQIISILLPKVCCSCTLTLSTDSILLKKS